MAESTLESPSGFEHRTPGYQGFIQALLLTSVFHNGLSFMTVGHKPTYISTLMLVAGGSGAMPLETLTISPIQGFQIAFPCIIRLLNLFFF